MAFNFSYLRFFRFPPIFLRSSSSNFRFLWGNSPWNRTKRNIQAILWVTFYQFPTDFMHFLFLHWKDFRPYFSDQAVSNQEKGSGKVVLLLEFCTTTTITMIPPFLLSLICLFRSQSGYFLDPLILCTPFLDCLHRRVARNAVTLHWRYHQ